MEANSEYRIIAPDLRGFGDSSYHHRFDSFDDLADDLIAFCDQLHIKKCFLLGWSAGAGVSYRLMSKKPELVEKFISLNGASYRGYPLFKKYADFKPIIGSIYLSKDELANDPVQVSPVLKAIEAKQKPFFDLIYSYSIFNVKKPDKDVLDVLFDECLKQRNLVDVDWSLASLNMSSVSNLYSEGTNDIGRITCPVLLLWGDKDLVVKEYMVKETAAALPNARLVVYPGASHALLLDEPERFQADVLSFLNQ